MHGVIGSLQIEEPIEHVLVYRAVAEARRRGMTGREFLSELCEQTDIDLRPADKFGRDRSWRAWLRYCAINAVHGAYPDLTMLEMGEIFALHGTSISHTLCRTKDIPISMSNPENIMPPKPPKLKKVKVVPKPVRRGLIPYAGKEMEDETGI